MKKLNDLKEQKVEPFVSYEHNGKKVIYYPETMQRFKHYKLFDGMGEPKSVTTKKTAIKWLES